MTNLYVYEEQNARIENLGVAGCRIGLHSANFVVSSTTRGERPSFSRFTPSSSGDEGSGAGWLGALHIAVRMGHGEVVGLVLLADADADERDSDGRTPLTHAAMGGHAAVAAQLLGAGARRSLADADGRSALHWAALCRREPVLRLLLERPPAPGPHALDAYDHTGWTPLHVAIHQGFAPGARLLIRYGASPAAKAHKCLLTRRIGGGE
ncbi:ankyrin repeat-containing domain protein [Durotheca rogersii]|uniref:ankyrin repeat-containing domain protein n=1 Tax=Durotheca rogersii TaxID=419775 RepID=UPI00221F4B87|nr:ankyrin repeat-containing domain protein [Durotheca rogersii]KAI5866294.1 ankyrin repeat-containing domain protein [Durotheca rogersii]